MARFQPLFLMLIRFIIYGLLGVCAEVTVSAILHKYEGKERNWSLRGQSYLWSIPLYGLIVPLELRALPVQPARADPVGFLPALVRLRDAAGISARPVGDPDATHCRGVRRVKRSASAKSLRSAEPLECGGSAPLWYSLRSLRIDRAKSRRGSVSINGQASGRTTKAAPNRRTPKAPPI